MALTYRDPLDVIWLCTAARLGWRVVRSHECYAAWDGRDTLTLSDPEDLDPDDCLAQLILHEICHALVEAPAGLRQVDWGLDNTSEADLDREHACHRLQAALTDPFGLRAMLAPTTVYRPYYLALGPDPLAPQAGPDPAIAPARAGLLRAREAPWAAALDAALGATAALARATAPFAPAHSLWARGPAEETR